MTVKLFRPRFQRRARWLLAIALLLPAAGLLQASGLNPVSIAAALLFAAAAAALVVDAARPTATIMRHGILIRRSIGSWPDTVSWSEIVRVETSPGSVSLTTLGRNVYQLHVDTRAAGFLGRMVERNLTARST